MKPGVPCVALLLALGSVPARAQIAEIRVQALPERPLIERGGGQQYLNFDFSIDNPTDTTRELERLEMSVFDHQDRLVRRQFLWSKGAASPGFLTVPDRTVPAKGALGLFNPFYALPGDLPLGRLHFTFVFAARGLEPLATATIDVKPLAYHPATRLGLPVDGPAVVYDGHDFYSHHRRIPLGGPLARRLGLTTNPVRYANDLVPVGPAGELARGPLAEPANWYGYGAAVRAPADGQVVSAANDVPDNRIENGELVAAPAGGDEVRAGLGNHLIIKHRDGEYSTLAHLAAGSVPFKPGDRVRRGQQVGRIGFSGDTGLHVHLHYMLTTEPSFKGEGLPAYFDRVRRVGVPGPGGPVLDDVRLDTGDMVAAARRN